jgi:hypothetical protein
MNMKNFCNKYARKSYVFNKNFNIPSIVYELGLSPGCTRAVISIIFLFYKNFWERFSFFLFGNRS